MLYRLACLSLILLSFTGTSANLSLIEDGEAASFNYKMPKKSTGAILSKAPLHGWVSINNGQKKVSYKPSLHYCGTDSFVIDLLPNKWASPPFNPKPPRMRRRRATKKTDGLGNKKAKPSSDDHFNEPLRERGDVNKIFVNVTVACVNDAPQFNGIANITMNEDGRIPNLIFSVNDIDTPFSALRLSSSSSNTDLLPSENIILGANGLGKGTIGFRLNDDKFGTTNITLSAFDGVSSRSHTFTVTVLSKNDRPYISRIANKTIYEDGNTGNIAFRISDIETPISSLLLSATSSNTNIVPKNNITFSGSGANRSVKVTPNANQYGSATITVWVTDPHGGTYSSKFVVTVRPINDAPTMSNIPDIVMNEDSSTSQSFTISDVDSRITLLKVHALSYNSNVRAMITGSGAKRFIKVVPARGWYGKASITVTVEDAHGAKAFQSFFVSARAVNDAPIITQGTAYPFDIKKGKTYAFYLQKGGTVSLTLNAEDSDNPQSQLTWSIKKQASKGIASVHAASGTVTYTVNANAQLNDVDHFIVQVSDGEKTDNITLSLTVNANVTFIHTDLLGSPVAETDINGVVQ